MDVDELARSYTEAWCSRDPARVASHYVPGGMISINGGEPAEITEVAAAFVAAFPDIEVVMNELVVDGDVAEYRWTFTGTSSETGASVRVDGSEFWMLSMDGLIAASRGAYDQADYDRQIYG